MKKFTKILAAVLVVSMLLSTVAFAAEFSDVKAENRYYEPIKILSAFGIINGYEDGTFGPDKDVTRAEFSKMLMGAMASAGIGNSDPAGMPFMDMYDPTVAWAVGDIRTAYDLGIINGMTPTTFDPKANVTYEQALKMIVCALNYGEQAMAIQASAIGQPWYYGYLHTARTLGLADNVTVLEGQPAKRSHIAQMVYNALDVRTLEKVEIEGGGQMYMESNQTWLKDKLKVTKAAGTLLADESNTMAANGDTARVGYALFTNDADRTNITIAKNNVSLEGLLGKSVEYYYKTDMYGVNSLVLVFTKAGSNVSVKVDASNIGRVTGSYSGGYNITYYESATATKEQRLTVAANPVISINGEVRSDVSADELNIESGSIEFISDGSTAYNKVNVESYKTYVVKSINKTDKYILDMYRSSDANKLVIDEEDSSIKLKIKNTSGSEITLSNIAQNNVLSVREGNGSAGRKTLDITVSTKNVTGAINEISDEYININGKQYVLSKYIDRYGLADVDKLDVGDSCKAYLDINDNIAYIMKTESSSTYYGYVGSAGTSNSGEIRLALISKKTTTMGSPYVTLAKKVRIDGESYSGEDAILAKLEEAAAVEGTNLKGGSKYSQVIKYTLNSSGLITDIDTVLMGADEDPEDETTMRVYENNSSETMKYNSSEFSGGGKKFRINSNTQIFLVPEARGDFEAYARKTSSFFKNAVSGYTVEAYNIDKGLNTAGVVVVYADEAIETKIDGITPLFIITNISQSSNSEGDPCDKIVGYEITYGGAVTADKVLYTDKVGVISGKCSVGDAIMYVTDNKGYVRYADDPDVFRRVLAVNDDFESGVEKIKYSSYWAKLHTGLLMGAGMDGSKQIFIMAYTDNPLKCGDEGVDTITFETSMKNYFIYDSKQTNDEKVVKDESFDMTSLESYNETVVIDDKDTEETEDDVITEAKAAKLFVYTYNDVPRAVIIIK